MASQKISDDRIQRLNEMEPKDGRYTLYWMQQSQRAEDNHALEFAIQRANLRSDPLLVVFVLPPDDTDANLRNRQFMIEGIKETGGAIRRRNIAFVVRVGHPPDTVSQLAREASEVICDRGYLRHHRQWRNRLVEQCECCVWQVESDAIIPVEIASEKREYAARTIRSKLHDALPDHLQELATTPIDSDSQGLEVSGEDVSDVAGILKSLAMDRDVEPVEEFKGGTSQARSHLKHFISERLNEYNARTDVIDSHASLLSPYLHFGQISPLQVASQVRSWRGRTEPKEAYIEELLVRRELAINFVHHESDYDSLQSLPEWAAETLQQHEDDEREHHYTAAELEDSQTHDPAWNAAMREMRCRGYLHNHLRMYWGKKIIEWTNTTQHAYRTALDLNNKYFLDGRDANSYANIAWLFGLHDRAHQERQIFGKVRYMSADGLRRKFDVDTYIQQVESQYGELT